MDPTGQTLARWTLSELVERAVRNVDSPHVDVGRAIGLSTPLRIGLSDAAALLQSAEPSFFLEVGDASVTVRRQDGGLMATLQMKF